MAAFDVTTVERELDGAVLIFQRLDDLWMIDRVARAANEQDDDDDAATRDDEQAIDGCTAVARDEVRGLSPDERRRYHARQLRKLALTPSDRGAMLLWSLITDFEHFTP